MPEEAELTGTTGAMKRYDVLPLAVANEVVWLDASGYELARSPDEFGQYDQSDLANEHVLDAGVQATVRCAFARSRHR